MELNNTCTMLPDDEQGYMPQAKRAVMLVQLTLNKLEMYIMSNVSKRMSEPCA